MTLWEGAKFFLRSTVLRPQHMPFTEPIRSYLSPLYQLEKSNIVK